MRDFPYAHTGFGHIVYDPFRSNKMEPWWCIVEVDKEITRYYREWLRREQHLHLNVPSWDAHITVVKGERSVQRFPHLWKKYHGKRVDFRYEHGNIRVVKDTNQPGSFYFINVDCPELLDIRQELQLTTKVNMHITIARSYY